MPTAYCPPPCVLRSRQRDADVISTLRRAHRHRRTLLAEHLAEAWGLSVDQVRRLARRERLVDALDDGRALTRDNYPGMDATPLAMTAMS